MAMRLSEPQAILLAEIKRNGGLYVKRYSRYGRTVTALINKGLVRIDERDLSSLSMDHYVAVENPDPNCRHCGEPIMWSLDHRRWVHDHPRVKFCLTRDENNNPITEAEPR